MDVKDAIAKAKAYAIALFSEDGAVDFVLEEVERDKARSFWLVTLSFTRARSPMAKMSAQLSHALEHLGPRYYKIIKIDEVSGEVISVTNRGLAA